MNTSLITKAALLSSLMLLAACGHRSSADISNYDETKAVTNKASCRPQASILVTEGTIAEEFDVIGDINATVSQWTIFDDTPTPAMLEEALKEKAHEVCADAVISARYGTAGMSITSWGAMEANGRAVKLKPAAGGM